jgi:hypothetical protein
VGEHFRDAYDAARLRMNVTIAQTTLDPREALDWALVV